MLAGQILPLAQLVLALEWEAERRRSLAWPGRGTPNQALQINLVKQARIGGCYAWARADGGVVGLLQAGKLLLQHQLLALRAELLYSARQNVIFVHLLVEH